MVLEEDNTYENGYLTNVINKTIACAPLTGDYYEYDSHTVHQVLVLFTTGHPSEDQIKAITGYMDEEISMKS